MDRGGHGVGLAVGLPVVLVAVIAVCFEDWI